MTERKRKTTTSPTLTYHEISEGTPMYLYSVSAGQFRNHIQCVKKFVCAGDNLGSSHYVTFDDGQISQYVHAFPVLQDEGIKATFFVTPGWTENRTGYMSWQQLAELVKCGHAVQSHGWSHRLLTQCDPQQLRDELLRSRMVMEDRLGTKVDAISTPGGRWNEKILAACAEAGYKRVFTSDPWMTASKRSGVEVAGRWMVTRKMQEADINSRLQGTGSHLYFLRASYTAKAAVRRALGDKSYQAIWRALSGKQQSMEILDEQAASKPGLRS